MRRSLAVSFAALALLASASMSWAKAGQPLPSRNQVNTADCAGVKYIPPQKVKNEAALQASVTARQNVPAGYELVDTASVASKYFGCFPDASPDGRIAGDGFYVAAKQWMSAQGPCLFVVVPQASSQEFRQLPSKEASDAMHLGVYGRRGAAALALNPETGLAPIVYGGVDGVRDWNVIGEEAQGLYLFAFRIKRVEKVVPVVNNDNRSYATYITQCPDWGLALGVHGGFAYATAAGLHYNTPTVGLQITSNDSTGNGYTARFEFGRDMHDIVLEDAIAKVSLTRDLHWFSVGLGAAGAWQLAPGTGDHWRNRSLILGPEVGINLESGAFNALGMRMTAFLNGSGMGGIAWTEKRSPGPNGTVHSRSRDLGRNLGIRAGFNFFLNGGN